MSVKFRFTVVLERGPPSQFLPLQGNGSFWIVMEDYDVIRVEKRQDRGWYISPSLVKLFEDRKITASEFVLLAKLVNMMTNGEKLPDQQIASWWGRSHNWMRATLSRLKKIGLIDWIPLEYAWYDYRTIHLLF